MAHHKFLATGWNWKDRTRFHPRLLDLVPPEIAAGFGPHSLEPDVSSAYRKVTQLGQELDGKPDQVGASTAKEALRKLLPAAYAILVFGSSQYSAELIGMGGIFAKHDIDGGEPFNRIVLEAESLSARSEADSERETVIEALLVQFGYRTPPDDFYG